MPCFYPLHGYRSRFKNANGKFYFTMKASDGHVDLPMTVPCGQCIGCRLERSKMWAVRCVHEASLHEKNCFITLTFNDEHLNVDKTLVKKDFQLFMKRLRKSFPKDRIRYFHCGEYGEVCGSCGKSRAYCKCEKFIPVIGRPHHHACLFGFDFDDKEFWATRNGVKLYRSPTLESIWSNGYCTIGDVTFDSAAYVARYIMKKITGDFDMRMERYAVRIDYDTGELVCRLPEYVTMSRRPGIAHDWISKYGSDVYPDDFVVIRDGIKVKPPKYYDFIFDEAGGDIDRVKSERKSRAYERKEDNTDARLDVKEELLKLRMKKTKRSFEYDF